MSNSTTRIVDLPLSLAANNTSSLPPSSSANSNSNSGYAPKLDGQQSNTGLGSNTYIPMNVYPNPFNAGEGDRPPFKLPSRDIPDNTPEFTHDPRIVANHIPPPPPDTRLIDHVREMERAFTTDAAPIRTKSQQRVEFIGNIAVKLQNPLLVTSLFFAFNTSGINKIMQLYLNFLQMFSVDGTLSMRGLVIKSVIVGCVFFVINESIKYMVSEFSDDDITHL